MWIDSWWHWEGAESLLSTSTACPVTNSWTDAPRPCPLYRPRSVTCTKKQEENRAFGCRLNFLLGGLSFKMLTTRNLQVVVLFNVSVSPCVEIPSSSSVFLSGAPISRTRTGCVVNLGLHFPELASPGSRKTAWRGQRDRTQPPDPARPQSQSYTARHTGQPPLLAAKAEAETSVHLISWAIQGSSSPRRRIYCPQWCALRLLPFARPSSFRPRTSPHRALSVRTGEQRASMVISRYSWV